MRTIFVAKLQEKFPDFVSITGKLFNKTCSPLGDRHEKGLLRGDFNTPSWILRCWYRLTPFKSNQYLSLLFAT